MHDENSLQQALTSLVPSALLEWQQIPGTEIEGFLLNSDSGSKPLDDVVARQVMDAPPFWSLLWPAGFLLCRLLASHPSLVEGRNCVDLGCGSGLLSVAIAQAGGGVLAADSDLLSRSVTDLHLRRHRLAGTVTCRWEESTETLFLADFLYDESNLSDLATFSQRTEEIVIVDCRLETLSVEGFRPLGQREEQAFPDLDPHREFGLVRVWYKGPRLGEWSRALKGLESPFIG
ncbi:MAG: hypothetical protein KC800_10490 [Candidatus Eremiobacteraeota bacterium]|nr:hypothetical protein [Candidatus Eremiobacteraeota bacterium]